MIELIHYGLNLVIAYVLKTAAFGKVLSNQTRDLQNPLKRAELVARTAKKEK
jgi:hypothetical protein